MEHWLDFGCIGSRLVDIDYDVDGGKVADVTVWAYFEPGKPMDVTAMLDDKTNDEVYERAASNLLDRLVGEAEMYSEGDR